MRFLENEFKREDRDIDEATQELLNIPGLEAAFLEAVREADAGEVVAFESIRRDGCVNVHAQSTEDL